MRTASSSVTAIETSQRPNDSNCFGETHTVMHAASRPSSPLTVPASAGSQSPRTLTPESPIALMRRTSDASISLSIILPSSS